MYRWADHTGELELHVEAESVEAVFAEALAAFGELAEGEGGGEAASHAVALEAPDPATLLADWLSELVFLADVHGFVPEQARALRVSGSALRATVEGRRGNPSPLVKAVTYHGLELRREDDVWRARVVLDV